MRTIKFACATIYQKGKKVGVMNNCRLIIHIAEIMPAPFPQPENTIEEASGEIIENYGINIADSMSIVFKNIQGDKVEGKFYIKPHTYFDDKARLYFELSGALTMM